MSGSLAPERMRAPGPASVRGLRWRIKDAFVSYIMGRAGGRYALADGAELLPDRYFAFPLATQADPERAQFGGTVGFRAHGGMLQLALSAPALRRTPDGIELIVAVDGQPTVIAIGPAGASAAGAEGFWEGVLPHLTSAGCAFFGDAYEPGEPLDALHVWHPAMAVPRGAER